MPHVLITEGHEAVNRLLCELMMRNGYRCTAALSPADAECVLAAGGVDLLIVEALFPGGESGLPLLELARQRGIKTIVVTAHPVSLPADVPVVCKPFTINRLLAIVRELVAPSLETSGAPG
jgi:DNA-binding response OmpR family regulator